MPPMTPLHRSPSIWPRREDVAFFFENLVVDLSGARLSYGNMRVGEGVVTLDLDLEVVGFPPPSSLGMI